MTNFVPVKASIVRDEFYKSVQLEPYMGVQLKQRNNLQNVYFCVSQESVPLRTAPRFLQEQNTTEHKLGLSQINSSYCVMEKEDFD